MIQIRISTSADLPALVAIWHRSVQATHDFLREQDFQEIETSVSEKYLPNTDVWVAVDEYDRPIGFMGLSQAHINTLFIEPELRGKGIGRMLIVHAEHVSGSLTVDVNEQNQQAVGFYKRMGFIETGRSAADDEGRPYPLLHLSKS